MQNVPALRSVSSPGRSMFSHALATATWHPPCAPQGCTDHQFVAMLNGYRDSGGLARAQEVLALARRCGGPDADALANWIAGREVIGFEWQSQTWVPLFQFNRVDMTRQPALGQIVAELHAAYDRWALATWFAQANPWLAQRVPADMLDTDPSAVLQAARADRSIANN